MSCPFARNCPGFEAFAKGSEQIHLAWAFCWGEYRDCDRYKCRVAVGRDARVSGSIGTEILTDREIILDRLLRELA
jgi:hypothetical protein